MITCKEDHRIGDRVSIACLFQPDDKSDPIEYNRYVDAAAWDADPEAVTAEIASYLMTRSAAEVVTVDTSKEGREVSMTQDEVEAKAAAILQAREEAAAELREEEERLADGQA